MGRKLRKTLPVLPQKLKPKWGYLKDSCKKDLEVKQEPKVNFNKRYAVKRVPLLSPKNNVWIDAGRN